MGLRLGLACHCKGCAFKIAAVGRFRGSKRCILVQLRVFGAVSRTDAERSDAPLQTLIPPDDLATALAGRMVWD